MYNIQYCSSLCQLHSSACPDRWKLHSHLCCISRRLVSLRKILNQFVCYDWQKYFRTYVILITYRSDWPEEAKTLFCIDYYYNILNTKLMVLKLYVSSPEHIMFAHADVTPPVGPPYWITASWLYPLLSCKLAKFSN